jgi:hypothetical protein
MTIRNPIYACRISQLPPPNARDASLFAAIIIHGDQVVENKKVK